MLRLTDNDWVWRNEKNVSDKSTLVKPESNYSCTSVHKESTYVLDNISNIWQSFSRILLSLKQKL